MSFTLNNVTFHVPTLSKTETWSQKIDLPGVSATLRICLQDGKDDSVATVFDYPGKREYLFITFSPTIVYLKHSSGRTVPTIEKIISSTNSFNLCSANGEDTFFDDPPFSFELGTRNIVPVPPPAMLFKELFDLYQSISVV